MSDDYKCGDILKYHISGTFREERYIFVCDTPDGRTTYLYFRPNSIEWQATTCPTDDFRRLTIKVGRMPAIAHLLKELE